MPDTREWFSTATELAEEGRYDEAIALLDQGIRIDANNANAWYNKGVVLFKMGRYQEALLAFAQATDIDPEFDQAWYNKGLALLRLRKYLEAIRAFDKALELNPRNQEARCQRDVAQRAIISSAESSRPSLKDKKNYFDVDFPEDADAALTNNEILPRSGVYIIRDLGNKTGYCRG